MSPDGPVGRDRTVGAGYPGWHKGACAVRRKGVGNACRREQAGRTPGTRRTDAGAGRRWDGRGCMRGKVRVDIPSPESSEPISRSRCERRSADTAADSTSRDNGVGHRRVMGRLSLSCLRVTGFNSVGLRVRGASGIPVGRQYSVLGLCCQYPTNQTEPIWLSGDQNHRIAKNCDFPTGGHLRHLLRVVDWIGVGLPATGA